MAITVNWPTKVISVQKVDMTLVQSSPTEIYELDLNNFRLTLADLTDNAEAMPFEKPYNHIAPVAVGGVQLARVVEIINDYTITFEDDQYAVNLVGANSNVGDRVNVNQVSVRSANSAGLVQSSEIEYSSYQNGVTLDVANGVAGQAYPIGTPETPVNNLEDAKFIANLRGFDTFFVRGTYVFGTSDTVDGIIFEGKSPAKTTIVLTEQAAITNCIFRECTITGWLDGGNDISKCILGSIDYIDGSILDCFLGSGTLTLNGTQANILRCGSGVAGGGTDDTPTIDMGVSGTDLVIRDYVGGIKLVNGSGASDKISIDLTSGQVVLDSTITAGDYTIRGVGKLTNNSTGTTMVREEILNPLFINSQSYTDGAIWLNATSGITGSLFPNGTPKYPVDNWDDAIAIRSSENLDTFRMSGSWSLTPIQDTAGCTLIGNSATSETIVFTGGDTTQTSIENFSIIGSLNGRINAKECSLVSVTGFTGTLVDSVIVNNLTFEAGTSDTISLRNCGTSGSFVDPTEINFNGATSVVTAQDLYGVVSLQNMTQGNTVNLVFGDGVLYLEDSCTSGVIVVSGSAAIYEQSSGDRLTSGTWNGGVTIIDSTVTVHSVWNYTGPS